MDAPLELPPKVQLNRVQTLRLIAVGIVVAFMILRVAPDLVRVGIPLGTFGYVTNDDGVVTRAPARVPKGTDKLLTGDRVRIDRILPFDRKPGLARVGYTRDNFERRLPVERNGRERVLTLRANPEPVPARALAVLRILLFIVGVGFGALMLIVQPRIMTFALFVFCLGGATPTTFSDVIFDVPWREIPLCIGDAISGAGPAGLLLFTFCLAVVNHRARVIAGCTLALAAVLFGALHAYDSWRLIYAGLPAARYAAIYSDYETVANILSGVTLIAALVRTTGVERKRTAWIVFSFALAGAGRMLSDHFFPQHLNNLENGLLLSLAIVPIIAVWVAVVRNNFFEIDFNISRALVYLSVAGAVIGVLLASEELLGFLFYNNLDAAYGVFAVLSLVVGAFFGKATALVTGLVDRVVLRERRAQRRTLERVAANLLDAEDTETVWRELLLDVPSILDLSFAGIMFRTDDGGYRLAHQWEWPAECAEGFAFDHPFRYEIDRSRGLLSRDILEGTMVRQLFPNDRLTFAAPLYLDRSVTALVLYGRSLSGLDIDMEERGVLIRMMGNVSIALAAIELTRYKKLAGEAMLAPQ